MDTITIQTANSIDAFYSKVETYYLDDISRMLRGSRYAEEDGYIDYCLDMKNDPMEELTCVDGGKALSYHLLTFIMNLTNHLDHVESSGSIFLVFAPTYRKLLS